MFEARSEMATGRYGRAAGMLRPLSAGGPGSDEAAYWLGECEKARGRDQAAADAWARVPPGSPFATRAIHRLVEMLVDRGRLDDARRLVESAMADRRIDVGALDLHLGMIDSLQGRFEDGRRRIEANWRRLNEAGEGASDRAIQLARLHAALRREAASRQAKSVPRDAEAERLEARYRELERRNQPIRDAAELARIAERLGSPFEARAFLTVAVAVDPDRADLRTELDRLVRSERSTAPGSRQALLPSGRR
jgi:tetratricopeptide (TPR) repeat protein